MDLINALQWRYACKKFDANRKIDTQQFDLLMQAINLTPSSKGLQAFKFLVIESPEIREKILPAAYFQKQIVDCSHLLIICKEKTIERSLINDFFERTVALRNLDKTAANIQQFEKGLHATLEIDPKDLEIWADNQIYLVMGNLLTSCAILEIDACPMEGFDRIKLSEALNLDALKLSPVLLCPLGYRHPDDFFQHYAKVRRPLDEIVIKL